MSLAQGSSWLIRAQFPRHTPDLLFQVLPRLHIQFQLHLLQPGQALILLPEGVLRLKVLPFRVVEMMSMGHTVHPVHHLGVHPRHPPPV